MDDQIFQAMLGTTMPDDNSADSSAMAGALRGQDDLGTLLSFAPGLEKAGQTMRTGALTKAKQIGDNRQKGLTRTRNLANDKLDRDKYEQTLKGYTDIEEYIDEQGNPVTRGISNRTGLMEDIQTGYDKTQDKYTSGVYRAMHIPGYPDAKFRINDAGNIQGPYGQMFEGFEQFAAKHPDLAKVALDAQADQKFGETRAGDRATEIQTRLDESYETSQRLGNTQGTLDEVISSIDAGAVAGNVSDYFMTLDNATAQLESALSNLTLDSLTQYKLTPVSDKDLAYVRKGAAPNLTAAGLKRWASHKKEAVSRMQQANVFMEDWIDSNGRVPRGDDRKYVEKQVDKILHGDGFEFAFDLDAEEKRDPQYNKADASSIPKILSDGGVTAADWAGYTDDQRKALMAD